MRDVSSAGKLRTFVGSSLVLILALTAAGERRTSPSDRDKAISFRWIQPASDPQLWQQVQSAFHDELAPDEPKPGKDQLDVYRYKYLQRVGIVGRSALVIVGHQPAKGLTKANAWDVYSSAYNFDLATRQISIIEHAEWIWQWKFRRLGTFGPSLVPDVTFNYLTCTECEPDFMFDSFYYDSKQSAWQVRSWGNGKDIWWAASDGLVVDMDLSDKDDVISYDCVYGILNAEAGGFQKLAIRCKEVSYSDGGRAKIEDFTLLYGLSDGQFRAQHVTDPSEIAELTKKACQSGGPALLCKLPAYLTVTSGQSSAIDGMFPNAPQTSRKLATFRTLKRGMSMSAVVRRCGEPDELGGSGIAIFIYHLEDGSLVAIGSAGPAAPLLYVNHIERNGTVSALLTAK